MSSPVPSRPLKTLRKPAMVVEQPARPSRRRTRGQPPTKHYGRWRAATLAGVYLLMGLHIAHWKLAGTTLAPLELNEVMYTLELGIVTAGFLFMLAAGVATAIFGRFFCSWGCHILALEDLCAWLLARLRMRPRPLRSRVLLFVPSAALFYMFIWPQIARVIWSLPPPALRVQTDAQGWASFVTTNFWRNLPEPWVAGLTFAICGFAIVYVLGARAFCANGCPYGVVFRWMDKFAPGRIIATGDCSRCGTCTAACTSGVRVHEELLRYGTVVNGACLKDLDCVAACPEGRVRYGFTRPPILRSWLSTRTLKKVFDFNWAEEALMAATFVASLLTFRGLYDSIPFLMTLGLGAVLALLAVLTVRMLTRRDVKLSHVHLKLAGRVRLAGVGYLAAIALLAGFSAHSAFIRYHEYFGHRAADEVEHSVHAGSAAQLAPETLFAALDHVETASRWGLMRPPRLQQRLGLLHGLIGEQFAGRGDFARAEAHLRRAIRWEPNSAGLYYNLAVMLASLNQDADAIRAYQRASELNPADPEVQNNLGFMLERGGDARQAEECYRRALASNAKHADANFNLGRLLMRRQSAEGMYYLRLAAALDPRYAKFLSENGLLR